MYLKSLVLKGFKSFADRSALTLEPGITAIVGPNGSGKSNISDAVLWVLGERNAKNLRGQAMEDVIFAGSSARKPVGLAEVDLVLDNSDGTLPVDYDEVVIARRMYRNGESEYLINGAVVRRMDVLDILHDSGLGTGTHSIISQGNLDHILQSKPEDRRGLIEEAAGVLKHKQRKLKSERKLANMDQHMARVRDVVGEVERQLGPLERKARKARTYQELKVELDALLLQIAVDDLRVLQGQWEAAKKREADLLAQIEQRKADIEQAEALAEQLQEKIRLESIDASALTRQHARISAAVERFDSTSLLMRERRRAAQTRAGELELALEANAAKRASAQAELEAALSQLEEVGAERKEAEQRKEALEKSYHDLGVRRGQIEREATAASARSRELEAQLDLARRKHAETQEVLANGLAHVKVIEGHVAELELQLARAISDAESLASQVKADEAVVTALGEEESFARQQVGEALRARDEARLVLEQAKDGLRDLSARIAALEEIERASAAAEGAARAWIMENEAALEGSLSPLSHAVQAAFGLESLVERLLGDDLTMLLVDDSACTRSVVGALRAGGHEGAVSFIMRSGVSVDPPAIRHPLTAPGSALINDLSYPESAARAIEAILGDVVVCSTLDEALAAHASDKLGLRFAALDGSVVWPSGKVSVGQAIEANEEGVLARVRHLEELRVSRAQAEGELVQTTVAFDEREERLRLAQATSLDLSQKLASLRGKHEAMRSEADRAQEKLAAVRRELEGVQRQRVEAEALIASARPDVEEYERKQIELDEAISKAKEAYEKAQQALAPLRREAHKVSDQLSEAKLAAATLAERHVYTERIAQTRRRDLEQLDVQEREARRTLAVKALSAQRIEPVLALFDELALSARQRMQDIEEQASAAQDSSSGLHAAVAEARGQAREAHAAYDEVSEGLSATRVEKGRLEIKVDSAVKVIVEDCATPLDRAIELPPVADRALLEQEAERLKKRIGNLGAINPDAAHDYDELKQRYDYLAGQLADLDSARKSLAKINRVIETRMKEDFVRTFEQVNANFKEIFGILFPGGTAQLSLVDPDDLENTGVEVVAQPAGKRITKMMLMSGGEKSLTALALLFAVYRTRTTPFYILDEVEAALDDTNLRRLCSYIDELRHTTQLIMITHQRRTMEMADVLFGVSMQADGVTKVISQRLEKALAHAEG